MTRNIIVAYSKNLAIGKDNQLLWHLADDMAFFKKMTTGKTVLMGRKTYESLPVKFRPLPNRINIVLSSQDPIEIKENLYLVKNLEELNSLQSELKLDDIFIIGGAQIYGLFIHQVDNLYITEVDCELDGDAFFPKIDQSKFKKTILESYKKNERNDFDFDIIHYARV